MRNRLNRTRIDYYPCITSERLTKCGTSSMFHDFDLEGASDPARKEEVEELGYCGADIVT